jgi:hypothetical protein
VAEVPQEVEDSVVEEEAHQEEEEVVAEVVHPEEAVVVVVVLEEEEEVSAQEPKSLCSLTKDSRAFMSCVERTTPSLQRT